MWFVDFIDLLRYPSYSCARVNTGTYKIGDGMGGGIPVDCCWRTVRGKVVDKPLGSRRVLNGDHDRTISILNTYVLYPRTNTAVVETTNRRGKHKIRLVKCKKGARSTILKEKW